MREKSFITSTPGRERIVGVKLDDVAEEVGDENRQQSRQAAVGVGGISDRFCETGFGGIKLFFSAAQTR
jgi:hypothetical protein